jgi:hypothetical protein
MTSTPEQPAPEQPTPAPPTPDHPTPEHRVTIRIAAQRDTRTIAPLLGQLGYPASPDELGERLERLTDRPDGEVLVAELDDEVVGLAAYVLIDVLERPDPQCRDHRARGRRSLPAPRRGLRAAPHDRGDRPGIRVL